MRLFMLSMILSQVCHFIAHLFPSVAFLGTICSANLVCIPTRHFLKSQHSTGKNLGGRPYATYIVPKSGFISRITLKWVSGKYQFCEMLSRNDCPSRWGAIKQRLGNSSGYFIYVTRDDGKSIIYPSGSVRGIHENGGVYKFEGEPISINNDTFVMQLGSQFYVEKGEVIRFLTSEVFLHSNPDGGYGVVCSNVTLHYDNQRCLCTAKNKIGFHLFKFGSKQIWGKRTNNFNVTKIVISDPSKFLPKQ